MLFADARTRQRFRTDYEAAFALPVGDPAMELLETIDDPSFPGAILPRLVHARAGDALCFYGVADSDAQWRRLAPLLSAAVGVTLTSFRGHTDILDGDHVTRVLGQYELARTSRFFTPLADQGRVTEARHALLRLRKQLRRAPARPREVPRSTEEVLRDFDLALLMHDRAGAEEAIAFLRHGMRLDTLNLHFLEVRVLATLGEWDLLTGKPAFASLINTRRPPAVTAALVEALFHAHITPLLASTEPATPPGAPPNRRSEGAFAPAIVEAFRKHVLTSSGTLFDRPLTPTSPAVAGTALLHTFITSQSAGEPRISRDLLDQFDGARSRWPEATRWVYDRVRDAVIGAGALTGSEVPARAGERWSLTGFAGELAAELAAAKDAGTPASAGRALSVLLAVLLAATTAVDLDNCRTAVSYVGRLAPDERRKLEAMPGYAPTWAYVSQFVANGEVPSSWHAWLRSLPTMTRNQARAAAEAGRHQWADPSDPAMGNGIPDFTRALDQVADVDREKLLDGLPHLLKHLQDDPAWPSLASQPVYVALLEHLLLFGAPTVSLCGAVALVFESILASGPDLATYRHTVQDLVANLVSRFASISTINWLIDLVDLTIMHPCQDSGARMVLWQNCIDVLRPYLSRLEANQLHVLADLAECLGQPTPFPLIDASEMLPHVTLPSGYTVGIYTTDTRVSQRLKRRLSEMFPDLRVISDHSIVGTTSLVNLARISDMLVVYWRRASHAATDVLERHRRPNGELIWAAGKGSSTILSEVSYRLECIGAAG